MSKYISILHYREKDKYPPLINFTNYLESKGQPYKLFTTKSRFKNRIEYISFTMRSLFGLIFSKGPILYYESISAIPIFIYFLFLPLSKRKLFIHYHEYSSPSDYKKQSFFDRLGHKLEKKLWKKAIWISHTNQDRLRLFKTDFPELDASKLYTLPNYPPESWKKESIENKYARNKTVKLVHIGALSLKTMYLQEVLNYFGSKPNFSIDFYSHKFFPDVKNAIMNHDNCSMKGAIRYQDIPKLKGQYDVGLVLYRASTLNVKYCVPNKVFEYLTLDLDVWCSDKIISVKNHKRNGLYPQIIMVDFEKLYEFNYTDAFEKEGLNYEQTNFVCEPVYYGLLKELNNSTN